MNVENVGDFRNSSGSDWSSLRLYYGGRVRNSSPTPLRVRPYSPVSSTGAHVSTADKNLTCRDCGQSFVFSASEQAFFAEKGFGDPVRCPACRRAAKARKIGAEAPPAPTPRPTPVDGRRPAVAPDRPRRQRETPWSEVAPLLEEPIAARSRERGRDFGDPYEGRRGWSDEWEGGRDRGGRHRRRDSGKGHRRRRDDLDDYDY